MKGQFPWIGRSRGSAGGMTTSKINDKNVMRAKAFEVTNPKTAAQVMQRDFFKEVQEVCASVTEDQLRTLFGVKPKTMTRRNALSKQIAAAYSIVDGQKAVDFSKLGAIGNGKKVSTPLVPIVNGIGDMEFNWDENSMPGYIPGTTSLFLVVFDSDNMNINIIDMGTIGESEFGGDIYDNNIEGLLNGYFYMTIPTNGDNVTDLSFGSFTIKTRATD